MSIQKQTNTKATNIYEYTKANKPTGILISTRVAYVSMKERVKILIERELSMLSSLLIERELGKLVEGELLET